MVETDNSTQKKIIVTVIIIAVIGVIIYNIYRYGIDGAVVVINGIISMLIWVAVIGAVVFGLYMLFVWEKRINAPLEVYKDITKESKISKPDNLRYLWLSGDKNHKSKYIGKIVGYSHRQNYKTVNNKYTNEDVFVVKRSFKTVFGLLFELITPPIIIRVPEELHDELHQDVKVNCVSLIKQGMYYYPDVVHLDFKEIDTTIYYESERYIQLKMIEVIAPLVQKAMGIRKDDIRALEGEKGIDIVKSAKEGK